MNASQRVLVNTFAQYGRTIINMVLSLYTVRVVLLALGESDYGIYTLVAGVVAMLSFITNSLVTTTQRFVSYNQGTGDKNKVRLVLNNSLVLHIVLGLFVVLLLELFSPFHFDGFLNIPAERIHAATVVFQIVILMLFLSFITSPFRALLISHENIVYISIVDVVDGFLKVLFAIVLTKVTIDKLIFYGVMMAFVQLFNFIALSLYCYSKYEECCLPNIRKISVVYIKEMLSFASWSIYSTGCIVGRQQGVAIVLNRWMGTALNAAYGIAFQIAGYAGFLSSALINAIAPQIMKAEGSGDRQKALSLSTVTCKFMFFLLSAVGIPCIFEIQNILSWWLKDVPEYAGLFCQMVLVTSMADSLTVGLAHINQAIGKIGPYSIVINTPKLLSVPLIILCFIMGGGLKLVTVIYVLVELFCSLLRLPFIRKTAGLDIRLFVRKVFKPILIPFVICCLVTFVFVVSIKVPYRFVLTFVISMIVYFISIFIFGLGSNERDFLLCNVKIIVNKINNKCR